MLLPAPCSCFSTAAGRSLVDSGEAVERVNRLYGEEETVQGRFFGGGASTGSRVRGARDSAIDEPMVRPSIDETGRAHGAGYAENRSGSCPG